jgi:enoyl-[acyl-carrier protein] reductase II
MSNKGVKISPGLEQGDLLSLVSWLDFLWKKCCIFFKPHRKRRILMFKTRLSELFGIEYPIIQAPMVWVAGVELAAAVSNAGGLGSIGPNAGAKNITDDINETGERLRTQIKRLKTLTDKPFAVNFPIEAGRTFTERCVDVALEEGIEVAITAVGDPKVFTKRFKDGGVKVLHSISNVKFAAKAEAAGVDGVIAGGFEGGGHSGLDQLTTMVLIPQVCDAVSIPVVAAGGIFDARSFIAAIALGAEGVNMGTRFMSCVESDAHPKVKEAMVKAGDVDTLTYRSPMAQGRLLKNRFLEKVLELQARNAPHEEHMKLFNNSLVRGLVEGDIVDGQILCGASTGMIKEMMSAADVIQDIVSKVPDVLKRFE